jgi:mannose-1-phosphate guanylyltransferase
MKAVIFAGGVGTRLWPLSRKNSPKQFEKIVGDKSTLQLTFDRLTPEIKPEDIYISTGAKYVDIIRKQLPQIPAENIIGEPEKKDVGPAVGLMMGLLARKDKDEPVLIMWSDHLVKNETMFKKVISVSESIAKDNPESIVFIGQKPRFASENLGWIEFGEEIRKVDTVSLYKFAHFKYRPDKDTAQIYFTDEKHAWNLGYFVTTPQFIYSQFKRFTPEIYNRIETIVNGWNTDKKEEIFKREYAQMPVINFDNAVIEQLDPQTACVINEDIGWTDVGAWEALKNALEQNKEDNITSGNVLLKDSEDTLVYNYDGHKLIVGIDLEDFLVVNTPDVLLVSKKTSVGKIKTLVESLTNTEHDHLT